MNFSFSIAKEYFYSLLCQSVYNFLISLFSCKSFCRHLIYTGIQTMMLYTFLRKRLLGRRKSASSARNWPCGFNALYANHVRTNRGWCLPSSLSARTKNFVCSFALRAPRAASSSKRIRRQTVRRIPPWSPRPRKSAISTASCPKKRRPRRANLRMLPRAHRPRRLNPCPRPNHRSIQPDRLSPPGRPRPPARLRPPDHLRSPAAPATCACVRHSRSVSLSRRHGWWPTISSASTLYMNTCP